MQKLIMGLPARFWAKTRIEDAGYETPCLTWTGAKAQGYGNVRWNRRNIGAHRLAYQARHGEIPKRIDDDRAVIDHLCRNRACVNVDHMEVVANRTNILRGETIQAANAAKTHCKRGHEFTEENTVRRGKYGVRSCRECRRKYQRNFEPSEASRARTHCGKGHELVGENVGYLADGRKFCRECDRAARRAREVRKREERGPLPSQKLSHCGKGHEFTPENTFTYKDGKTRKCRECMREQSRKARARRKQNGA